MVEKIGIIGSLSASGGIEKLTIDIVTALDEAGIEVNLLPIGGMDKDYVKIFGKKLDHTTISNSHILNLFSKILIDKYKSYIIPFSLKIFKKVDLVFDVLGVPIPIFNYSHPYVLYVHFPIDLLGSIAHANAHFLWKLELSTLRFTINVMSKITGSNLVENKYLLCNSNFTRKWIRRVWKINANVFYPSVNLEDYKDLFRKEPRKNYVIMISRFSPEKRHMVAIKALRNVIDDIPDVQLHLVGSSKSIFAKKYIHYLKRSISELRLDDNVVFHENLCYEELRKLLSRSKIFVHTNQNESFGIAVIEGMASGCVPIVHSSGAPYEDIIDKGKFGLFFSDENDLSEAILKILKDDKYRKRMKFKAYKRVYNQFTYKKFKKNLLEFIEKII